MCDKRHRERSKCDIQSQTAISLICLPLTFITKFQMLKKRGRDHFIICQELNHICRIKVVGSMITFWKLSLSSGKEKKKWVVTKQWRNIKETPVTHISFAFPLFISPHLVGVLLKVSPSILVLNLHLSSFSPMFKCLVYIPTAAPSVYFSMLRLCGTLNPDCICIHVF